MNADFEEAKGVRVFYSSWPLAVAFVGPPKELLNFPHPMCANCKKDWKSFSYKNLSKGVKERLSVKEGEELFVITL